MSVMETIVAEISTEMEKTKKPATPENTRAIRPVVWFQNLPIKAKLIAVFGSFFIVSLGLAAVAGIGMTNVYHKYQTTTAINHAAADAADLRNIAGEMRYQALRYTVAGESAASAQMTAHLNQAKAKNAQIRLAVMRHKAELVPAVDALSEQLTVYQTSFGRVQASLAATGRSDETTRLAYDLAATGDALYRQTDDLQKDMFARIAEMEEAGMAYFTNLVVFVLAISVLAIVILTLGLRYLSSDLVGKVTEINGAMNKLAIGEADFEIEGSGRKDEIGDMVRALDVFKAANARLIRHAKERESVQQKQRDILHGLADRFERTVGDIVSGVAAASTQLKSTAGEMAGAADGSSHQADMVSSAMSDASTGVTAAATASDEFAMSIGEISRQAASSAELARQASVSAHQADETISALSVSAQQVGNIVELIHSIARRTNLLALNASIEAARGGDAGRGFAVVASEVKELAAQTSRATEEVADQIRAMQSSTTDSVTALRSIGQQVSQLETAAISIASAVDEQSVAGQDLARSIDLAARSSDEVSASISSVREASLATGAAASQVLNSATDLEEQAATLRNHVTDFLNRVRN
ncbi:methyl-accepting chemotaxis protein [Pontixanthobacter sp.]|uniref:methyl-accepting chemotaxis protein n=1 Tax=Pontixanthobacter sp. TaxID=2792078 RepID=UPI003C7C8F9F